MKNSALAPSLSATLIGSASVIYLTFLIKLSIWLGGQGLLFFGFSELLPRAWSETPISMIALLVIVAGGIASSRYLESSAARNSTFACSALCVVVVVAVNANKQAVSESLVQMAFGSIVITATAYAVKGGMTAESIPSLATLVGALIAIRSMIGLSTWKTELGFLMINETLFLLRSLLVVFLVGAYWRGRRSSRFSDSNIHLWVSACTTAAGLLLLRDAAQPVEQHDAIQHIFPSTSSCQAQVGEYPQYSASYPGTIFNCVPSSRAELNQWRSTAVSSGVRELRVLAYRPGRLGLWSIPKVQVAEYCTACVIHTGSPDAESEPDCLAQLQFPQH